MMYINIDTIHYPNHFYIENAKHGDTVETHAAALHYIDARIENFSTPSGKPDERR